MSLTIFTFLTVITLWKPILVFFQQGTCLLRYALTKVFAFDLKMLNNNYYSFFLHKINLGKPFFFIKVQVGPR